MIASATAKHCKWSGHLAALCRRMLCNIDEHEPFRLSAHTLSSCYIVCWSER